MSYKAKITSTISPNPFIGTSDDQSVPERQVQVGGVLLDWDITDNKNGEYILNLERNAVPLQDKGGLTVITQVESSQIWVLKFNDNENFYITLPNSNLAWTIDATDPGTKVDLKPFSIASPLPGQLFAVSVRGE